MHETRGFVTSRARRGDSERSSKKFLAHTNEIGSRGRDGADIALIVAR